MDIFVNSDEFAIFLQLYVSKLWQNHLIKLEMMPKILLPKKGCVNASIKKIPLYERKQRLESDCDHEDAITNLK